MFHVIKQKNKTLRRINESLKKENEELKRMLMLYDSDKLNEQLKLSKDAYEEYKKLSDELMDLKTEYKGLIREVKKQQYR